MALELLEERRLLSVSISPAFKTLEFTVSGSFNGSTLLRRTSSPNYVDHFFGGTSQTGTITYTSATSGAGSVSGDAMGGGEDNCSTYGFRFDASASISDNNGVLTKSGGGGPITYTGLPAHCQTSGSNLNSIPLQGTFSTNTFRADVKWRQTFPNGYTKGTWSDSITFTSQEPYDVALSADDAEWTGENALTFKFTVSGPPQRATSHTTPVGHVRLYWAYGDEPTDSRRSIGLEDVPIYWNSAGATVTVTGLPKTAAGASHLAIVADPEGKLAESVETNNFVALPLIVFQQTAALYDEAADPDEFGKYLPGITLLNQFETLLQIHGYDYAAPASPLYFSYSFGGGYANGFGMQVSSDSRYIFSHDMGSLAPRNQPLVMRMNYVGYGTLETYTGLVLVATDLNVKFDVDYGDGPVDLENLRLLGEVTNEGSWQVKATVSDMPLPAAYSNVNVQLQMQAKSAGRKRTATSMQRLSHGVYQTQLNFGQFRDLVEGADYEFSLKGDVLRANAVPFTRRRDLLAITIPKWLRASSDPTYDAAKKAYDLKIDYKTTRDPISSVDPFGLLNAKATWGSLHIVAPIFAKPDVTKPVVAELEKFEIVGSFLGQPVGPYSVPTSHLEIQLDLDNATLDVGDMLSVQMRRPITITGQSPFNASGANQFKIPKIPLPNVGVVDTQFDVSLSATGSASVRAGIALKKVGAVLEIVPYLPSAPGTGDGRERGSFVEIGASGGASASLAAGISAIQVGPCNLVNLTGTAELAVAVHGTVWTSFSGRVGYANGSLAGKIRAQVDFSRSGAAIGAAYRLNVQVGALCNLFKSDLVQIGPGLVTHQLFGGKNLEGRIQNSYASGQGIFAKINPPTPAPSPSAATTQPLSSPAASSPPTPAGGSPEEPQGSLEVAAPMPGSLQSLAYDLQAYASGTTLTAGRHRVDVVLASDGERHVVDTVDLASLALSPADHPLGNESEVVRRFVLLPDGLLDAASWYSLSFEFYSDGGAGGEVVEVAIDNLELNNALPEVQFSAPNADLSDDQLDFGPDTHAAAETVVTVTNTGGATLPVERIEIAGSGFTLVDAPAAAFLLSPGQSVPVRVRLDMPGTPATATLRVVTTGDAAAPVFELPLAHDGVATIDVTPPLVSQWLLRSSAWPASELGISPETPSAASGINQIVAVFSEPVDASAASLAVWGATGPYAVSGYTLDAGANRATWTLAEPLGFDNVAVELASDVVDGVGLPLAATGPVTFAARPGDIDGDDRVGLADIARIAARLGESTSTFGSIEEDINRDGQVDRGDVASLARYFGAEAAALALPNQRPVFAVVAPPSIDELQTLTLPIAADDPDASGVLQYSLVSAPQGATINATSGEFVWTPSANDGPGTHLVTVRVVDGGNPPLATDMTFAVQVMEPDVPPQIAPIADQMVLQGETLFVPVAASDANGLADPLSFSLDSAPAAMAIDPSGGLLWTPTYADAAGDYAVTVRASSASNAALFTTTSFTVHVEEANVAPEFVDLGELTFGEGDAIEFQVTAVDPNGGGIVYALLADAPPGAAIDPITGVVTWNRLATDATGTYRFTAVATDDGSPALASQQQVTLTILESNSPPFVEPIADVIANAAGEVALAVVASDLDVPAQELTFALEPGAADGAAIDAATGAFYWPVPLSAAGPYTVTVRVEDDGPDSVPQFVSFTIGVMPEAIPPVVAASLLDDTGADGDAITYDPTIVGAIVDTSTIVALRASAAADAPEDYVDVSWTLAADGTFTLDESTLAIVAGGVLGDGPYTIYIIAEDTAGNASLPVGVSFELAASPPTFLTVELAAEHDSDPLGDGETDEPLVDLVGATDPLARVLLAGLGIEAMADALGDFRLVGVPLAPGYNTLVVRAETAGGLGIDTPIVLYRTPDNCTAADPAGSMACVVTPTFEDVTAADQDLLVADDDAVTLAPSELGGFQFTFYGETYDTFYIGSNGLITFGDGYYYAPASDLVSDPFEPTIAVLADDWTFDQFDASGVYWQVLGEGPTRRLVVQWQDATPYLFDPPESYDPVTFQVVLYEASGRIQFNYLDLGTNGEANEAGTATVGVKGYGDQSAPVQWLPISIAAGPNVYVGSGKSTLITPGDAGPPPPDFDPPEVYLWLTNDTLYEGDGYTTDASISGQVIDASPIARLDFMYDSTLSGNYPDTTVDILPLLQGDGTFEIPQALLENYLGTTLVDGDYWFLVEAEDIWGNVVYYLTEVYFTYDTTPPAETPTFDLATSSDGVPVGDRVSPFGVVALVGFAEPYTEVFVEGLELETLAIADDFGNFILRRVPLAVGANTITVVSRDLAGNAVFATETITYAPQTCLGPDGFGYQACLVPTTFVDISTTGVAVPFDDVGFLLPLAPDELGTFSFDFYGTNYETFYVAPVGAILPFAGEEPPWNNSPADFVAEIFDPVIAPLWDVPYDYASFIGSTIYWQVDGPAGNQRLIVQWHDLAHWGASEAITFQAILYEASGAIDFNYLNLDTEFDDPYQYAWSFAGIRDAGEPSPSGNVLYLAGYGLNDFVATGGSVRIQAAAAPSPPAAAAALVVHADDDPAIEAHRRGRTATDAAFDAADRQRADWLGDRSQRAARRLASSLGPATSPTALESSPPRARRSRTLGRAYRQDVSTAQADLAVLMLADRAIDPR